jgi:hypothetical protein
LEEGRVQGRRLPGERIARSAVIADGKPPVGIALNLRPRLRRLLGVGGGNGAGHGEPLSQNKVKREMGNWLLFRRSGVAAEIILRARNDERNLPFSRLSHGICQNQGQ